jgi:hypothetical protein
MQMTAFAAGVLTALGLASTASAGVLVVGHPYDRPPVEVVVARPRAVVWVGVAPPILPRIAPPPPRTGWVWIAPYWSWTGSNYVWVQGAWAAARPGYTYVGARWERAPGGGWIFAAGHWARI